MVYAETQKDKIERAKEKKKDVVGYRMILQDISKRTNEAIDEAREASWKARTARIVADWMLEEQERAQEELGAAEDVAQAAEGALEK